MKAWALAAAAAVLLMAGTVHAQIDGPCIQTVRGCDGCFEDDPTRCATCAIKSGFIEVADWTANKCDCEEGLQLVGDTCQPVTPPNPGPDPSQPNQPDQPGSRYAKARACPRRFPNCRACDKNLRRCVECAQPHKLQNGACVLPKCRKGYRRVNGRCVVERRAGGRY